MLSAIERAFELARCGDCKTIFDVERQLRKEGFEQVSEHLNGAMTRRQLLDAMNAMNLDVRINRLAKPTSENDNRV